MSDELPPQTRREAREAERRRALADAEARREAVGELPPATGLTEIPTELIAPPAPAPSTVVVEPDAASAAPAGAPSRTVALRSAVDRGRAALTTAGAGVADFARRHPLGVRVGAGAVAFLLLATGSLLTGIAVGSARVRSAPATEVVEQAADRAVPADPAAALPLRTCSVSALLAPEAVGALSASVVDAATGEVLLDRSGGTAVAQGTGVQVVTAAAALAVLGPDYRIETRVVDAGNGSIALVGSGDATLSALPAGQESFYPGAPKLSDLATQTLIAYSASDSQISSIVLDAGYWSTSDQWNAGWDRTLQTGGVLSQVTALQVDGDRADPAAAISPRSTDPVAAAGQKFLAALRAADTAGILAADVQVTVATAPAGSRTLASVDSQPVSALVGQMIGTGDATLAEMLARVTSKVSGSDGSAASLTTVDTAALATYDAEPVDLSITDGSGYSAASTVPPAYLALLMVDVQSGERNLDEIRGALGVAGESGALAARFAGSDAAGHVSAAPGAGAGVYSLSGFLDAEDGSLLAFSLSAGGAGVPDTAPDGLDAIVSGFYACGGNLSTN